MPYSDFAEGVLAVSVARADVAQEPKPSRVFAALKSTIASSKVPKQVLVVPELPRNATVTVQKELLREQRKDTLPSTG